VYIRAFSYTYVAVYADRIELHTYKIEDNGESWCMDEDVIQIPS
jgi:hypothetical protein